MRVQKVAWDLCGGGEKMWTGSPRWRSDSALIAQVAWLLTTKTTNVSICIAVYGLIGLYAWVVGER